MLLADFFTKSLQGKAFKVYRDVLMGYKHISTLSLLTPSSIKERVGKTVNSEIIVEGVKSEERESREFTTIFNNAENLKVRKKSKKKQP